MSDCSDYQVITRGGGSLVNAITQGWSVRGTTQRYKVNCTRGDARVMVRPTPEVKVVVPGATERVVVDRVETQVATRLVQGPAGPSTGRFAHVAFTVDDWGGPEAGRYHIEITHEWETWYVGGFVLDSQYRQTLCDYQNHTVNKSRIYVPAAPDLRFDGVLVLFSLPEQIIVH